MTEQDVIDWLMQLSGYRRVEALQAIKEAVTEDICSHCGCDDPRCQCWNDE